MMRLEGITKSFGSLRANDNIDFDLQQGEIHVLVGENGAGKSTLMNMMYGALQPDSGQIFIDEEPVRFRSPRDAIKRSIGMVHQHFTLVPHFTAAENIALGTQIGGSVRYRSGVVNEAIENVAADLGISLDMRSRVDSMPVDAQQRVEIVKALSRGAQLLILDEPTALLGPKQIEALLGLLQDFRSQGRAIVLVTHKLAEVLEVADRVTVLRRGKVVFHAPRGEFDARNLSVAMTGGDVKMAVASRDEAESSGPPVLEIIGLRRDPRGTEQPLDVANLVVRAGEIVGIAGVEGNGQRELVDILAGLQSVDSGSVRLNGSDITSARPAERRSSGLAVIPEDRHHWGLILSMNLADNLWLNDHARRKGLSWLNHKELKSRATAALAEFDVRPTGSDHLANSLSGGNQQKVVIARELMSSPSCVVAHNPTWGLDVGATQFVREKLLRARADGAAILLVSMDLDELFALSDRIAVINRGRIVLDAKATTVDYGQVGAAMAGFNSDSGAK